MEKLGQEVLDVLTNYPRITGALMGVMLHPVFNWFLR